MKMNIYIYIHILWTLMNIWACSIMKSGSGVPSVHPAHHMIRRIRSPTSLQLQSSDHPLSAPATSALKSLLFGRNCFSTAKSADFYVPPSVVSSSTCMFTSWIAGMVQNDRIHVKWSLVTLVQPCFCQLDYTHSMPSARVIIGPALHLPLMPQLPSQTFNLLHPRIGNPNLSRHIHFSNRLQVSPCWVS